MCKHEKGLNECGKKHHKCCSLNSVNVVSWNQLSGILLFIASVLLIALLALFLSANISFAESSYDESVVIKTLIGEAGSEKGIGMQAVGEVIRNRASKLVERRHGKEWHTREDWQEICMKAAAEVCLAKKQFSFWNDKARADKWLSKHVNEDIWHKAMKAWYASADSSIVKGATMYDNFKDFGKPNWDMSKLQQTVTINKHTFFREI